VQAAIDAFSFAGLLVGLAAAALAATASLALGLAVRPAVVCVAFAGTLVVYNVDRVRDLQRDRATAPMRTRYLERHGRSIRIVTVLAGAVALAAGASLGGAPVALLAACLALGLLHRRLKRVVYAKALYITTAWLAVVVGVPALSASAAVPLGRVVWTALLLGAALLANATASSVKDEEAAAARHGVAPTLWLARALTAAAALASACAPSALRPLAWIPLATLVALLGFRASERYAALVLDGALLAGALLAGLALAV
jgi:hypothetical protein